MKQTLLFAICCCSLLNGFSQKTSAIYAISGQSSSPFNWSDIRVISPEGNSMIFENGKPGFRWMDADSKKEINTFPVSFVQPANGARTQVDIKSPTYLMSAAAALDKRHNKLFFATMHSGHLVWLDLNRPQGDLQFYIISTPMVSNFNYSDESLNITRMAIGADGNGYAISNDGNHFIQFTTGRKTVIADQGMLQDDPSNKSISIHNQCAGWGGDMVADVHGNLFLFSAGKNVFEINVTTKVAKYLGVIKNLPAQFTVNGAAVDDDGNVMISSANVFDGFYTVNMKDLSAQKTVRAGKPINASDLASGNLLGQSIGKTGVAVLPPFDDIGNEMISIYPNPVKNKKLKISFDKNLPGKYSISITDLQGRLIQNKIVNIKFRGQVEPLNFDKEAVSGLYMIKITDVVNKEIFSGKIFVE